MHLGPADRHGLRGPGDARRGRQRSARASPGAARAAPVANSTTPRHSARDYSGSSPNSDSSTHSQPSGTPRHSARAGVRDRSDSQRADPEPDEHSDRDLGPDRDARQPVRGIDRDFRAGLDEPERFSRAGVPQMLGDLAPSFGPLQHSANGAVRLPWVRGYKMADNQSPRPQDRVTFMFNFYDNVNPLLNPADSTAIRRVKIYREFFGIEKTFLDQNASIGLRLPVNTMVYGGTAPGAGQTNTAVGDLIVYGKYILWQDEERRNLVTLGLAFGVPTGPGAFAGAPITHAPNPLLVQPFLGYIKTMGDWFLQGFTGVDVPTDGNVVTIMYNDVGLGYYFRTEGEGLIRGIAADIRSPRQHALDPPAHARSSGPGSALGTPDVVDLTFGTSVVLRGSILSVGIVNPVTGPRPFSLEAVVNLNIFYGRRAGRA